jgi:hypothetical protein
MRVYKYVCIYVCIHVCVCVWIYVWMNEFMYLCMYVRVYVYMYECTYLFIYLCFVLRQCQDLNHIASNRIMTLKWSKKGLEESARGLLEVVSRNWPGGNLRKTKKKYSIHDRRFFGRDLKVSLVLHQLTLCSMVGGYEDFGETCFLFLQVETGCETVIIAFSKGPNRGLYEHGNEQDN